MSEPSRIRETGLDIVELPQLGRRIEWPTVALAVVIYGLWFLATFFWRELPWQALTAVGAWIIAWQPRRVERQAGRSPVLFWHCAECVPVLTWIIGVCGMPVCVYVACFVYPGMSLTMVRSLAEHRAAPEPGKPTAIVENARILGPLFLYNNLHVAHHLRGELPWYQIPTFYRLNRAALVDSNGGLVYRSYFDVARRCWGGLAA